MKVEFARSEVSSHSTAVVVYPSGERSQVYYLSVIPSYEVRSDVSIYSFWFPMFSGVPGKVSEVETIERAWPGHVLSLVVE